MTGKVWITQQIAHLDYRDATRFGKIVVIATVSDEILSTESAAKFDGRLFKFLEVFNPDTDHIMLSGDPVIIAAVMMAVGEEYVGSDKRISLLKWDNKTHRYNQIILQAQ